MAYIRSNEDYDRANGTWKDSRSLASDLSWKHTPDSVKNEIKSDLRERGYSDREITEMTNGNYYDQYDR